MPSITKTAHVTWYRGLTDGHGVITSTGSGALPELPVSFKDRTEEGSATSPEELIAAAHAACYSMALSGALARGGHAPSRLDVDANCTFEFGGEGGPRIGSVRLRLVAEVPGMDEAALRQAAEAAKDGCPVSKALKGNVDIGLEVTLA